MNAIKLLEKLVAINSVFPHEHELTLFIQKYLENLGITVERVKTAPKRYNLVATTGNAKSYIAFYAHMDTVPPDALYKTDPFKLRVKGDKIMGLGASDMKGAITAFLKTAEYAQKHNLPAKFIFGVDEENLSQGAYDLVKSSQLNDIKFIVSGERGLVQDFSQPFSVVYGRRGRAVFDITIHGQTAHVAAATQGQGINAITQAAKAVNIINNLTFTSDKHLGKPYVSIQSIAASNSGYSIPDKCLIQCSFLPNSNTPISSFKEKLSKQLKKNNIQALVKLNPRETPYLESFVINRSDKIIKAFEKAVVEPYDINPIYTISTADECVFAKNLHIPVISLGPIGGNAHTKDEWMSKKSFHLVEKVYRHILKNIDIA